jgi:hypothetical protein
MALHVAAAVNGGEYDYETTFVTTEQQEQEAEEQRLHEIIVEDWYDLVRYLVGLGFCIFGLIGLYFHQFASYYFLKRYTNPSGTERKIGRVISCEPMRPCPQDPLSYSATSRSSSSERDEENQSRSKDAEFHDRKKGYRIFVVYSAAMPTRHGVCGACGPDTTTNHTSISAESLVEMEYFQWFRTSEQVPVGSAVSLILLKDNPKSACTPELLNTHLMLSFSEKNCCAISVLGISLVLGVSVLSLASVFEILSMPHPETQRPIGWSILISFFFLFVITGWIFCKMLFDSFKAKVFLSAIPAPNLRKLQKSSMEAVVAAAVVDAPPVLVAADANDIAGSTPFVAMQYTTPINVPGREDIPSSIPMQKVEEPVPSDEELSSVSQHDVGNGKFS